MEENSSEEFVTVTDSSGNGFQLIKYDGLYFPSEVPGVNFYRNTKQLHKLEVDEKDVIILAYCKSGTHWTYEMIGMLLNGTTETIKKVKEMSMTDVMPVDELNSLSSPRILNSHYWPRHLPLEVLKKVRLVYLLRNPKDVAVSIYNHIRKFRTNGYDGEFNDFLGLFLESKVPYGSWFGYVRAFENFFEEHPELNPLILYYEDIIKDPVQAIRKLAKYLNLQYSEDFLEEVAEACHIDRMRINNETKREDLTANLTADGKSPMYRKGKVGDWKNWFTVANSDKFDAAFEDQMKGSRLKFVFE